ncbi:MAG: TusE/DsrC/DsvC family sulfur relay protein [Gammaproteobacteria bacterium]|nr:TusE/DsrC/DsvC family sulfur relay protein [Gammaproteobacteria bacterium]
MTKQGNLIERYAWSEAMAEFLAGKEGIALTDDHWEVINFIRGFYNEYLISPMIKLMIRHMQETMSDEKSNKDYLYQLFPEGPAKQGARIAGLPHPVGCID